MLLAQPQKLAQVLVFALIRLRRAHTFLNVQQLLFELLILGLQRFVGKEVVIVSLRLPVDGGDGAAQR